MSFSSRGCNEQYLCEVYSCALYFPFVIIHRYLHSILINLITADCDISYLRYSIIQHVLLLLLPNISCLLFAFYEETVYFLPLSWKWKSNWNWFMSKTVHFWWTLHCLCIQCVYPACILFLVLVIVWSCYCMGREDGQRVKGSQGWVGSFRMNEYQREFPIIILTS